MRPLRRWALESNSEGCWKAARTALWAGAVFQDLMVKASYFSTRRFSEDVPFPQALFLNCKLEDWQKIRHLLPGCHDLWRPRKWNNGFGNFFLEPHGIHGPKKLSPDKIRATEDAGLDLHFFFLVVMSKEFEYADVTVLDMAIWCGEPDCAEACVDGGIELKHDDMTLAWHKRVLRGGSLNLLDPSLDVVPSEAQSAAAAAGRTWVRRCWKSESSQKGIVLYQMMVKMVKGRSFPMALVQEILSFSMPVPKIINQLDLWEHVGDWMATICSRPTSVLAAAHCNTANVEEPEGIQDNGEAGTLLLH